MQRHVTLHLYLTLLRHRLKLYRLRRRNYRCGMVSGPCHKSGFRPRQPGQPGNRNALHPVERRQSRDVLDVGDMDVLINRDVFRLIYRDIVYNPRLLDQSTRWTGHLAQRRSA